MSEEEFLKAIESVPKTDSINPISAYNSINVEDLANAVDRFKKVPTYDELLKKNQKYKEVIDKIQKIINTEIKLMGYAVNDSCLMLIQDALDILKEVE